MTRAAYIDTPVYREAPSTLYGAIAAACWGLVESESAHSWPSERWRHDPVAFAHDVLGVKELSDDQVELLEAIRDNRNVSARSGHKCGKSLALAIASLWFWCCFPSCSVVLTAVKEEQIERVIWKEVKQLYRQAKRDGIPLGGTLHSGARAGLKAIDADGTERNLWGMVARSDEGAAGISGANVFLLFDEASGIADEFFVALGTSLAGGGGTVRKAYISNPTRESGEFFRSHTTNKDLFRTLHISSLNTPNALGTGCIPGLADKEWLAEKRIEWGEDSALWKCRVLGEFVTLDEGKIFSLDTLTDAETGWSGTAAEGRLQIGCDPAGPADGGDESGFAIRRGNKVLRVYARRGLSDSAHVVELLAIIDEHRKVRDPKPVICIDREGPIGGAIFGLLRAHVQRRGHEEDFEIIAVKASQKATRRPDLYDRVRDEVWANGADWMKDGGTIPDDAKLTAELFSPSFFNHPGSGKLKVTPKSELRKELGRSPDRADAFLLAVWSGASVGHRMAEAAVEAAERAHDDYDRDGAYASTGMDPYALDGGGGYR